LRHSAGC